MKLNLIAISLLCFTFSGQAQSILIKVGVNYNTTIQKYTPEIPGLSRGGYDPKYGYQFSFLYKQPLIKSLSLITELGLLNKGHQRLDILTNRNLGNVNYYHISLVPTINYDLPLGISLRTGVTVNYLVGSSGIIAPNVEKFGTAYLVALGYTYQKIGFEVSYNKGSQPIQKSLISGQNIDNYHRWYAASLTFQLFKKQAKSN
jgi:hypothetical protein